MYLLMHQKPVKHAGPLAALALAAALAALALALAALSVAVAPSWDVKAKGS